MQDLFFFITSLCQKFNQPFPCQYPAYNIPAINDGDKILIQH